MKRTRKSSGAHVCTTVELRVMRSLVEEHDELLGCESQGLMRMLPLRAQELERKSRKVFLSPSICSASSFLLQFLASISSRALITSLRDIASDCSKRLGAELPRSDENEEVLQ